jgi:hypothetical protein
MQCRPPVEQRVGSPGGCEALTRAAVGRRPFARTRYRCRQHLAVVRFKVSARTVRRLRRLGIVRALLRVTERGSEARKEPKQLSFDEGEAA